MERSHLVPVSGRVVGRISDGLETALRKSHRAVLLRAAATTANWRVAVIDAATATEVALTTGLTARLSATLSPGVQDN